jgi:SAM-dependent methyltransferase
MNLPEFALLYHAHHDRHPEDIPFWLDLAAGNKGPVLELGCGTGRILFPLARAGYQAYGFDRDPGMLSVLRYYLPPNLSPYISYWQGDFTAFCLAKRFPLIILPCNTLSTLTTSAMQASLQHAYWHLAPGGTFAASMPNPRALADLPPIGEPEVEEAFPHPETDDLVQVSSSWRRNQKELEICWDYDRMGPDGAVHRISATALHFLRPVSAYRKALQRAGFRSVRFYGDFDFSPYRPDSPNLIFITKKPRG